MKNEAISPARSIAIQEISLDSLFKETSEWSGRIARHAYELFANSGFTNGHDVEDWLNAEQELLDAGGLGSEGLEKPVHREGGSAWF